jgi:dATP pyrophosphohydrolase
MPHLVSNVIDVYPYRRSGSRCEYLLLRRRADTIYAGEWRMVGGKIHEGEKAWEAARRELEEETGCVPVTLWAVPSANVFYEWQTDNVHIITAFAAEIDGEPALNHEHDAYRWFEFDEARTRLRWPEQRRLIEIVDAELDRDISVSWRVPVSGSTDPSQVST